jgi:hypothetical protein
MEAQPPTISQIRLGCKGAKVFLTLAWLASALLGLWLCAIEVKAQEATASEYQVKAAFLVNFTKYVEWPEKAFTNATAPFIIGILGEDKFGQDLSQMLQNKTINGHPLLMKHFQSDQQPDTRCHILFIGLKEKRPTQEVLDNLCAAPVLTVGESDSFLSQGGVINFVLKDKKVRLQISLEASDAANLKISSKMLGLADLIKVNPPLK